MEMLPIFEALISNDREGIVNISLVDDPAVESNFLAFRNQSAELKYSVQNEEQRIVFGVLMRADYNIFRYDENIGKFYVRYSKETVKKMAEKLMLDKNHNNINIMHVDGSNVAGVNMVSLFIKDVEKGISPIGFEEIEDGSLFASFHVDNDVIWSAIKDGTFRGFSIEGLFSLNNTNKEEIMSLKAKILNAVMKFGEVETDKGMLYWTGEEDLKAGDEVYVGEEKERAEDGEYTTLDSKVIKVVDGVVSEIVDTKAEVDSTSEEFAEEMPQEPAPVAEPVVEVVEEPTNNADYDELKQEVARLSGEVDSLKGEVAELRKFIDEIKEALSKPAAEPIEQQFEKTSKNEIKKGNAARILSHIND